MTGIRPAAAPFVSVVLPVRNEARDIGRCLDAILAQDYPADRMEVLVADGMSDDATRDVVAAYSRRDRRVRLLENPGRIVPTALNAAIRAFEGEILVRVDGHTIVDRDYVSQGVAALARSGADVVGGTMAPVGSSPFGRAVALATSTPMGVGGSSFHYASEEREAESVYMGTFRREAFARFGRFNERCKRNQDDEFNYRVREGGGRVVVVPSMRSRYFPRESPRALFGQYFQYGYYKVLVAALHPRMMRPRHVIPSGFVIGVAGLAAAATLNLAGALLLAAALALHVALSLALAWREGRRDPGAWLLVPAATLLIHLAYGSGFLIGCFAALAGRAPGSSRGAPESAP
jgi:GT2 family glycosyltransferase